MKTIHLRLLMAATALLLVTAGQTQAVSVTYTFEQFGAGGQTTPLLNVAPDSGPPSFTASFTSSPNPAGFGVFNFQPNGLFSGNSLAEPGGGAGNTLTVSLNMAITSVSLVFATNSFSGFNSLFFFSSSGTTSVASTSQSGGAGFDGGVLTFSSSTAFTSFSLNALGDGKSPIPEFAIDNLVMEFANGVSVPEGGSTLAMGAVAALVLIGFHRLRAIRFAA